MKSEILSLKIITNEFDFLRKTITIQLNTWKRFVVACKQINKKIPDLRNAKEHYQSFARKTNTKSGKQ